VRPVFSLFLLCLQLVRLMAPMGWAQDPSTTSQSIQVKNGYLVIATGSIGDLNNLTFLLDTGTSRTLLDARIAKRLRLAEVAHRLTVFDHEVEVKLVTLPDLRLGAIQARSPRVIATDLSGVAQRFGLHVDAVIGMDILCLRNFGIDYRSKRIWFDNDEPMPAALGVEGRPQTYLIVKARIDNLPVALMTDTGCEDVILFRNRLPDGLRKDYSQPSRAFTVAGEAPSEQIASGKLVVGISPAHKVKFHILETGNNDMGYDGILGARALHASRIHFNFEKRTVSWR
jgi:predicted aspartyl protease